MTGRRTNLDAVDSEREQALRWLNFAWQALFSTVREHEQLQAPQRIQIEQLRAEVPAGKTSPRSAIVEGRLVLETACAPRLPTHAIRMVDWRAQRDDNVRE